MLVSINMFVNESGWLGVSDCCREKEGMDTWREGIELFVVALRGEE